MANNTVILADGAFPQHPVPLEILNNADRIICCDGAALSLVSYGLEPFAIIGDCDSLTREIQENYNDRIFRSDEQETNDLTKAVTWCSDNGFTDLVILGATGKREDHTIGNISLLIEYSSLASVRMITDTGIFLPVLNSVTFETIPGQQISLFATDPVTEITSEGLKYPLKNKRLHNWWVATLNEAEGDKIALNFSGRPLIIFFKFPD